MKKFSGNICLDCQRAAGNDRCEWSKYFMPVAGWVARPTHITVNGLYEYDSYYITECPKFIIDAPRLFKLPEDKTKFKNKAELIRICRIFRGRPELLIKAGLLTDDYEIVNRDKFMLYMDKHFARLQDQEEAYELSDDYEETFLSEHHNWAGPDTLS